MRTIITTITPSVQAVMRRRAAGMRPGVYGCCFSSDKESLIGSMNQVVEGTRYFEQRNIPQAISYLQQSLTILPFYMPNNASYNQEFEVVACRLAKCYAWEGEIAKVEVLTKKVIEAAKKIEVQCGKNVKQLSDVLVILGKTQYAINFDQNAVVRDNLAIALKRLQGKMDTIPLELIKASKEKEANAIDLSPYLHSDLRSSIAFVLTSLLAIPDFPSNPQYNKLCSTLLKSAEKSSQKNVIKALILLITNLLRNRQYLQAQGMAQYCLQRKRENLKPFLLKTNQEYILLQLLLAATFEGVERMEQSKRLREQFNGKFDVNVLLAQQYLLDSI